MKKAKTFFLVLFYSSLIVFFISRCKSFPKPLSENEAYTLFNEVILDDTLIMREIYYRFDGLVLSDEMKKEFTADEVDFMQKQIENLGVRNKEVKPNKIVWFHRNYKQGDFVKLTQNKDSGSVTHISFPIISSDRKKMLIHMEFDCNCMLGGSGADYLYEKKNGVWKEVKTFNGWIS